VSRGSRRDGFERLRDIITQHRRGWSERFLESYLRARWQSEFGEASRRYSRYVADEGKPPTAFQFAKTAAAANHWLGGNLAALYTVIGEKSPVRPERIQLVPSDVDALAKRVFVGLGGEPFKRYRVVQDRAEARRQHEDSTRYYRIRRLAEESPRYLQLQEALGQPPSKQQFGRSNFDFVANEIWGDVELGWQLYTESIARALEEMPAGERPPGEPLTRAVVAGSRQASVGKHGRKSRKAILDRLLGR
jgi:hypothetical protein